MTAKPSTDDVRPLGGYAARQCPVRTQNNVVRPVEPAPMGAFMRQLADQGIEHERAVCRELVELGATQIDEDVDATAHAAATLAAMDTGDMVILDGRLPTANARTGKPDVLVRVGDAPVDGRWRYAPVEIKSHAITADTGVACLVQPLDQLAVPHPTTAANGTARRDDTARGDVLQLAHYHRMLEATWHAQDGPVQGGVIGSEGHAVWLRLDQPDFTATPQTPRPERGRWSALALYDVEFAHRLEAARTATAHLQDESLPLLLEPAKRSECDGCPWQPHCIPWLAERADPSLLPKVSPADRDELRRAGHPTIHSIVDAAPSSDIECLDAELILQARAWQRGAPLPRPGVDRAVPAAEVEIDVDMESTADGAYLWGAHVRCTGAARDLIEDGYRAFVVWPDLLDEHARAEVFNEFWTWLADLVEQCSRARVSLMVFCWSAAAENRYLRDGATLTGREAEVEQFIDGPHWHDLLAWFRRAYVTGRGNSLKTVATSLGFTWRDDDPSGAASMTWYRDATDPAADDATRAAARQRLLAYNEDDVLATLAIRDALRPSSR